MKAVGSYAFAGCKSMKDLIIWGSPNVDEYAFANCSSIKEVSIGSDTKYIGPHAYEGCTGIDSLIIWGVEEIGEYAFAGCTGITELYIPTDTIIVRTHAFDSCTALKSVTAWGDTIIEKGAFENCPNLTEAPAESEIQPVNETTTSDNTVNETESNKMSGDEAMVSCSEDSFKGENYRDVGSTLAQCGFTNITYVPLYDIIFGITESESTKSVSIDGTTDFKEGDVFKKGAEIIVTYHMPTDEDPTNKTDETESAEPTATESTSNEKAEENTLSYTTNDLSTAKKGNSGVFSYKDRGTSYSNYLIIDFDEGYVYWFQDGDWQGSCDKIAIESGDLNEGMIITYHDEGDEWSYALHFNWKNQPDHLIIIDEDYIEYDYYYTELDNALSIRDTKTIYEY